MKPGACADKRAWQGRRLASLAIKRAGFVAVLTCLSTGSAGAAGGEGAQPFSREEALAISQSAIGRVISEHRFIDSDGSEHAFGPSLERPLVISLIYTSCYHTCPMITKNLQRSVRVARDALGEDSFEVVTIGFDWQADTPERMAIYAREQGIKDGNWEFLSGSEVSIRKISEELGFIFYPSPRGFDHLAQTTIVDAGGAVFWQVYGASFDPPQLVEPLKRLVFKGRHAPLSLEAWIDGVKFFCTIYDPSTGRYRFDYSIFVALFAGLVSLGAVAVFVVRAWRQAT